MAQITTAFLKDETFTTHVMTPMEFLQGRAALAPRPRPRPRPQQCTQAIAPH